MRPISFLFLTGAAIIAIPQTAALGTPRATASAPAVRVCQAAKAIDGDTIRCAGRTASSRVKIRLIGIDAPELPGHCRVGRVCADGDPFKSRANLAAALAGKRVTYQPLGLDRYGRRLAVARAGGVNVACEQLHTGNAIYKPDWDNGRRISRECGL